MTNIVPTTGAQVVKAPQYIEEGYPATPANYGVMPASPTFVWIGLNSQIEPSQDPDIQERIAVASEDVQAILQGKQADMIKLTFDVQSSTFLKYAINAVNWTTPTGTVAATFSLLYSILMNGTENFITINGCRPNSLKLKVAAGQNLTADMEVWGAFLNPPTVTGPTTPTYATPVSTAPWNFTDEGTTPVTIGGTNVVITDIEADFARNLKRLHTLQSYKNIDLPPTTRNITGKMTVVWSNSTYMVDLEALTESSMVWTLKSSTSTITFTNMSFRKLDSLTTSPKEVVYEKYSWAARSATVT